MIFDDQKLKKEIEELKKEIYRIGNVASMAYERVILIADHMDVRFIDTYTTERLEKKERK